MAANARRLNGVRAFREENELLLAGPEEPTFAQRGGQEVPPMPGIAFHWEYVTPDLARRYLERNFERNRKIRKGWIRWLVHLLKNNQFLPTHQGAAFDEDGFLIDGQHRLLAIAESGVSSWLSIANGVPRRHVIAMDRHARRSDGEQIRIADEGLSPGNTHVAVARMMYSRGRSNIEYRLEGEGLVSFIRAHWDAIEFSCKHATRKRTSSAGVRSAVASDYYHASHDRLEEFLIVLDTGESNGPSDFAAIKLREGLDREARLASGGASMRAACFRLTCSALLAFLSRRPITKIFECSDDPYPLPAIVSIPDPRRPFASA